MLLVLARKMLLHDALFWGLIGLLLLNYMLLAFTGNAEKLVPFFKCWQWQNVVNDSVKSVLLLRNHESCVGHWELRTRNSRLFLPLLSFYFMETTIFTTHCISPLLWLLVNLQPNLRLICSSWIMPYDIHYVLSNFLFILFSWLHFLITAISSPSFLKFIPLYACR